MSVCRVGARHAVPRLMTGIARRSVAAVAPSPPRLRTADLTVERMRRRSAHGDRSCETAASSRAFDVL
ncbi:MAG: hypothetical protein K6T87_18240 [Roseiflexus sp.]|uniref:hypothetical protein n=1 Tax=Roseiflexus sp. TaxID=2562120 RepID=UPI0025DFE28F|nr:hypothetical protein [Roseiflexus sp.]MCL6542499.1 hypothetical protein [Roseiflexus sp.]